MMHSCLYVLLVVCSNGLKVKPDQNHEIAQPPYLISGKPTGLDITRCGGDGLGASVWFNMGFYDVAERFSLTYVCNPLQWCGGHEGAPYADLFGCINSTYAVGKAVAYNAMKNQTGLKEILFNTTDIVFKDRKAIYIYSGHEKGWGRYPGNVNARGIGWRWLRDQYHLTRRLDATRQTPECWQGSPLRAAQQRKVVIHIRRGDKKRGFSASTYGYYLDRLFAGTLPVAEKFKMNESDAHLIIIAETPKNDTEMAYFKQKYTAATVSYRLGEPTHDPIEGSLRLRNDLDCMALSDVLLFSYSSFSALGTWVQQDGALTLSFKGNDYKSDGPNVQKVVRHQVEFIPGDTPNSLNAIMYGK